MFTLRQIFSKHFFITVRIHVKQRKSITSIGLPVTPEIIIVIFTKYHNIMTFLFNSNKNPVRQLTITNWNVEEPRRCQKCNSLVLTYGDVDVCGVWCWSVLHDWIYYTHAVELWLSFGMCRYLADVARHLALFQRNVINSDRWPAPGRYYIINISRSKYA